MNIKIRYVALIILIVICTFFGLEAVSNHVDEKSGKIVESVLSDNTISQLKLITEVQSLINSGEVEAAKKQLNEAATSFRYILKNNCNLAKCKQALYQNETNK